MSSKYSFGLRTCLVLFLSRLAQGGKLLLEKLDFGQGMHNYDVIWEKGVVTAYETA